MKGQLTEVQGDGGGVEGVARQVEINLRAGGGGGAEVAPEVDAEGAFGLETGGDDGGEGFVTDEARVIGTAAKLVGSEVCLPRKRRLAGRPAAGRWEPVNPSDGHCTW